jgi:hypothetical protein
MMMCMVKILHWMAKIVDHNCVANNFESCFNLAKDYLYFLYKHLYGTAGTGSGGRLGESGRISLGAEPGRL